MIRAPRALKLAAVAAIAAGCATFPPASPPLAQEQEAFWAAIEAHCGRAYEGRVAISTGSAGDTAMAGKRLVMHVRECKPGEIRIPFHVGDDRSRTWVLTRTATGLRLKHDHRHQDGTPDAITQYGGDTRARIGDHPELSGGRAHDFTESRLRDQCVDNADRSRALHVRAGAGRDRSPVPCGVRSEPYRAGSTSTMGIIAAGIGGSRIESSVPS